MFVIDQVIFLSAILLLLGIISSKISARAGLPLLVLFLLVGMLAGQDGIGGIRFDNPLGAHALGTLALAIILYDGGLQTQLSSIRAVWKPSALLATAGVLVTAVITGLAAHWVLGLSVLEGLLIGAIVGSTDAAAVFTQLRNAGVNINKRIKSILEIESASNDPMAIFLTVGLLEVLVNGMPLGVGLLKLFVMQMGIGTIVGLGTGWLGVRLINRIELTAAGLYPVLVAGVGLFSFGLAANLGGSGFLAVFLTGVVVGNSRFVFQRGAFLFLDGLAWLGQITMFVVLGLLINPKELLDVWLEGLLIAIVLICVARPLAVIPMLKPFGFNQREITLVSWVGLRGSVPIILAVFPLIFGLPGAPLIFNVVFFVVLLSATVQGSTLSLVASRLGLTEPTPAAPPATLEITSLGEVDADIVEYTLGAESRAASRLLAQAALPDGAVVAMITRGKSITPPRGSTRLLAGDHLFVVMRPELRPFVDCALSRTGDNRAELPDTVLRLKGATTVEAVRNAYGIALDGRDGTSLDNLLRRQLEAETPAEGDQVISAGTRLEVLDMVGERIATVGLQTPLSTPEEENTEATITEAV